MVVGEMGPHCTFVRWKVRKSPAKLCKGSKALTKLLQATWDFMCCIGAFFHFRIKARTSDGEKPLDLFQFWTKEFVGGELQAERHLVRTSDGFLIVMHRLVRVCSAQNSNVAGSVTKSTLSSERKVVFLQHALLESSFNWIASGSRSLPFVLAREGHDIWLGNNRGNLFASYGSGGCPGGFRASKNLSGNGAIRTSTDKCPEVVFHDCMGCETEGKDGESCCYCLTCRMGGYESFWNRLLPSWLSFNKCKNRREHDVLNGDWTFEEMAKHDLTSMLRHINVVTNQNVVCIGVSQGAAQLLVHAATCHPKSPTGNITKNTTAPTSLRSDLCPKHEFSSTASLSTASDGASECCGSSPDGKNPNCGSGGSALFSDSDLSPTTADDGSSPSDASSTTATDFRSRTAHPSCGSSPSAGSGTTNNKSQKHVELGIEKLILFAPPVVFRKWRSKDSCLRLLTSMARRFLVVGSTFVYFAEFIMPPAALSCFCDILVARLLRFCYQPVSHSARCRIYKHTPNGGTSFRNMRHFVDMLDKATVLSSDGPQWAPYPLERISDTSISSVTAFIGTKDNLVDPHASAEMLHKALGNRAQTIVVKDFGHLDFHWGTDRWQDFFPAVARLVSNAAGDCDSGFEETAANVLFSLGWEGYHHQRSDSSENVSQFSVDSLPHNQITSRRVQNGVKA